MSPRGEIAFPMARLDGAPPASVKNGLRRMLDGRQLPRGGTLLWTLRRRGFSAIADPDALYPARIGVDDFEIEARHRLHDLALHRDAPGRRKNQPTERFNVVGNVACIELRPDCRACILEQSTRIG